MRKTRSVCGVVTQRLACNKINIMKGLPQQLGLQMRYVIVIAHWLGRLVNTGEASESAFSSSA